MLNPFSLILQQAGATENEELLRTLGGNKWMLNDLVAGRCRPDPNGTYAFLNALGFNDFVIADLCLTSDLIDLGVLSEHARCLVGRQLIPGRRPNQEQRLTRELKRCGIHDPEVHEGVAAFAAGRPGWWGWVNEAGFYCTHAMGDHIAIKRTPVADHRRVPAGQSFCSRFRHEAIEDSGKRVVMQPPFIGGHHLIPGERSG